MNISRLSSRNSRRRPSGATISRNQALPAGGTTVKRLRPSQNTSVATAIIAAGMPKAAFGPYLSSSTGQYQIEIDEPRLIEK